MPVEWPVRHPFQLRLRGLFAVTALIAAGCVVVPWLMSASFEVAVYMVVVALTGMGALLAVLGWKA